MIFVETPEWLNSANFTEMVNSIATALAELDGTLFLSMENNTSAYLFNIDFDGTIAVMYVKNTKTLMYRLKSEYLENTGEIPDVHIWAYDWLIARANLIYMPDIVGIR